MSTSGALRSKDPTMPRLDNGKRKRKNDCSRCSSPDPRTGYVKRKSLLSQTTRGGSNLGDLPVLRRSGDRQFLEQQYDQAVTTYARAADLARRLGDEQSAFELDMRRGAVLRQIEDFPKATAAFRELALATTQPQSAAQAHLLAITSAAMASPSIQRTPRGIRRTAAGTPVEMARGRIGRTGTIVARQTATFAGKAE